MTSKSLSLTFGGHVSVRGWTRPPRAAFPPARALQLNCYYSAIVDDGRGGGGADQADVEGAGLEHSGVGSFAGADRKGAGGVVPVDGNHRTCSLFVGIGQAVVFVEAEVRIGAGVDAQLHRVGRLLVGPLHIRA